VGLSSVTAVQAAPASVTAVAPAPAVQAAGSTGATALLSRYIGITGGGDRLDDGLTTPDDSSVLPVPKEDRPAPAPPAAPAAPADEATMNQSMSHARLDAFFIAACVAEATPASAPVTISPAEERATVSVELEAGMTGLIALLGGCWTVQPPREEGKKQPAMRDRISGG
jgi:hypothetical protein